MKLRKQKVHVVFGRGSYNSHFEMVKSRKNMARNHYNPIATINSPYRQNGSKTGRLVPCPQFRKAFEIGIRVYRFATFFRFS